MAANQGKRLTPRRIEGLKPKGKTYRVGDRGAPAGLLLEVRPTGSKSWLSRVTVAGRRVDMTIGAWPDVTLDQARADHLRSRRLAAEGIDPRHDRQARRRAPRFAELMESWLAHLVAHGRLTPRTVAAHRRRWKLHLARLDSVPVAQLTRQAIAAELTRAAEKAPAQARACLTTVRMALGWAVHQVWLDTNPAADMQASAYGAGPSRPRAVTLDLDEIRQVWAVLEEVELAPATVAALRILVLTGARRAEVAGMEIEELDLDAGAWNIPAERTKTSTARTVYLCPLAVGLLREQLGERRQGPVFVAQGQAGALSPDSLTTAVRRLRAGALAKLAKRKPFTVHDLRRSAATCWGEYLEARPELIDRMLGHARRNLVEAAYQHQTYERQQRAMFEAWGDLVGGTGLGSREKVTLLHQKQRIRRA